VGNKAELNDTKNYSVRVLLSLSKVCIPKDILLTAAVLMDTTNAHAVEITVTEYYTFQITW
jgi:hypothetical protein